MTPATSDTTMWWDPTAGRISSRTPGRMWGLVARKTSVLLCTTSRLQCVVRQPNSYPGTGRGVTAQRPQNQHPKTSTPMVTAHPEAGTWLGDLLWPQSHRGSAWISPRPGKDEPNPSVGGKGCSDPTVRDTPMSPTPTAPLTRQASRFLSEGALARMLLAGTFPWGTRGMG